MTGYATRLLEPDDWQLWRGIRLRALADAPDSFGSTLARESAFAEEDWREGLSGGGPRVLVSADGEAVAIGGGFVEQGAIGSTTALHVIAMWTDPAWRGRGLAARVLGALVEWAAPRGLTLVLDVAIGNVAARNAYEAFGFISTGRRRPLRDGSTELVEQMVLSGPLRSG
ncbi:MAG: GNAT family N-acetyltransferase [Marmoricola sp.]